MRHPVKELGYAAPDDHSVLPGDDILPDARVQVTHRIDIEAPPAKVWPWLAQMGRAVGDVLPMKTKGEDGLAMLVVDPPRALVLGDLSLLPGRPSHPPNTPRVTWAFSLEPIGSTATHLVVRVRVEYQPSTMIGLLRPLVAGVHELMEGKQLRTIKQRAEAR